MIKPDDILAGLKIKGKGKGIFITITVTILFLVSLGFAPGLYPQVEPEGTEDQTKRSPKVFIECETCNLTAIREEIKFVNYTDSPDEAQVHIIVTSQKTETGEEEFTLAFRGQKEFEGDNDTQKYRAEKGTKPEEVTKGLVGILKMGLMRYVGKTPISSRISVNFLDKVKPTAVVDKWNFWVFSISVNSFLDGETSYKDAMFYGSCSAVRITPELKVRLSLGGSYEKQKFSYDDQVIESSSHSENLQGIVVKSINDHWSVGGYFSVYASKYSNIKLSISPAPAIEYDLFPYSESTKKQLRFLYRLSFNSRRYNEETIYEKTYENLWSQSLSVTLELKQKWGTVSTSLEGSHYFHDFSKNHIQLWGDVSLRIIKGLNFNVYGSYSRVHDQLGLARQGASLEEILLRRRELETTYDYYFSIGLSYTFGSTSSRVVNPRFGDGGTSVSISF